MSDLDLSRETYAIVAARRTQFDQLVWQVPVLSLTAQAFLFSIALSHNSTECVRLSQIRAQGAVMITATLSSRASYSGMVLGRKVVEHEKDRPRTDRWSIRCCGQRHRCQRRSSH
jgi:hypothetical protein